jgi:hypothetical protein
VHDARLGRFLSVDPLRKEYPWYSTYQHAGNTPIAASDRDGLEEFIRTRYFDAVGNLYRVELQVIGWLDTPSNRDANGLEPVQMIHDTQVNVDNFGNATAQYMGFTYGNRVNVGTAGNVGINPSSSDAFTLQENLAISDITPNGAGDPRVFDHRRVGAISNTVGVTILESSIVVGANGRLLGLRNPQGDWNVNQDGKQGVMTINVGPSPANEVILATGYNRTPADPTRRWMNPTSATPANAPTPSKSLKNRTYSLGEGVFMKQSDNDPIGTTVNGLERNGSGPNDGILQKQ